MPFEHEDEGARGRPATSARHLGHCDPPSVSSGVEPASFRVDVNSRRDHADVVVIGELDLATAGVADGQLRELHEAGSAHVVLNLRGVSFMDCSGLRVVLTADSRARETGRRLVVVCGDGQVKRLFALARVDRRLEFSDGPVLTLVSHD